MNRCFPHPRRPGTRLLALAVALTLACGDGILLPDSTIGYYRLISVNGQPLPYFPPPSLGLAQGIGRGDLVLRADGSFMQVGGPVTGEGTYRAASRELLFRLRGPNGVSSEIAGRLAGDSLSVDYPNVNPEPLHLVFRRAQPNQSLLPTDRYRLTSVNGGISAPFVLYDTTIAGTRFAKRVRFDSLTFLNGVFFRAHRSDETRVHLLGADSLIIENEGTIWGAFESSPAWIHLYFGALASPRDSLAIRGDTLVRRTPFVIGLTQIHRIVGVTEERYTAR